MERQLYIKTNRTKYGYARATFKKFGIPKENGKWVNHYHFQFYSDDKYFNTYKELKEYVENKYQLYRDCCIGAKEYHLPEDRNEFFN